MKMFNILTALVYNP